MKNEKPKKNIYLAGGGGEDDSFLLDKDFVDSLPENPRILYIPFASDPGILGYEPSYQWIVKCLSAHTDDFLSIDMWDDFRGHDSSELDRYDAVYIGGGNTFRLLDKIYKENFDKPLKKFINKGGIVYGGSAGAIIMGSDINIVEEENDRDYKNSTGLSMLGYFSLICHYEESLDQKIGQFIEKFKIPVIALSERSGLKINDEMAISLGYDDVIIFDKNLTKKKLKQGDRYFYINGE